MPRQDAFRSQFRPIADGGCELHKLLVVDFPLAASPAGSAAFVFDQGLCRQASSQCTTGPSACLPIDTTSSDNGR
jgi:hypothetical protein